MAKIRHLKNAPIKEAVIDFRAKVSPEFDVKKFLVLKDELREKFPKFEERLLFKGGIKFKHGKPEQPITEYQGIHGYFFKTQDEKKVVQFRIDGFTFSKLKPYTNWEEVFREARELWEVYLKLAKPESIPRLAVRYINHIEISLPIVDLSKYFTKPPEVPDDINSVIHGFLSKLVVYNQSLKISANIIQALEKSARSDNTIIIILDIDAFKVGDFISKHDEILITFKDLHNFKNQIFFNSITEETARLFE
jgi:uncharacterized protein (TIGR04255 family)